MRHLLTHSQRERTQGSRPVAVEAFVAAFRNRIKVTNDTAKDRFHLEPHRARQAWGLLTRTAARIAAHTFAALWPLDLVPIA